MNELNLKEKIALEIFKSMVSSGNALDSINIKYAFDCADIFLKICEKYKK